MPLPATTTGGYTIRTCFPVNADAISYVDLLNASMPAFYYWNVCLDANFMVSACRLHCFSLDPDSQILR